MVRRLAMRIIRRVPQAVSMDDILSAGWLGLVEARRRRDACPTEAQFEAYAAHRVRGAMLDYLRGLDPMSRRQRQASRSITTAIRDLTQELNRPPTEEEIAASLGLDPESFQQLLAEIGRSDACRLEGTDPGSLASPLAPGPEELVGQREMVGVVAQGIDQLPERLQLVLGLYYQEELSLAEIGEVLGVTESRACQLHSECIHRLRATLDIAYTKPVRQRKAGAKGNKYG
jgi:RNA polymerase sigma factor for flagellar operon FliA